MLETVILFGLNCLFCRNLWLPGQTFEKHFRVCLREKCASWILFVSLGLLPHQQHIGYYKAETDIRTALYKLRSFDDGCVIVTTTLSQRGGYTNGNLFSYNPPCVKDTWRPLRPAHQVKTGGDDVGGFPSAG